MDKVNHKLSSPPGEPHTAMDVASLQPTTRRIPRTGTWPRSKRIQNLGWHMDQSGRTNRTWRGQPPTWHQDQGGPGGKSGGDDTARNSQVRAIGKVQDRKDCTLLAKINGSYDWLRIDTHGEAHTTTNTTIRAVWIAGQISEEKPGQARQVSADSP